MTPKDYSKLPLEDLINIPPDCGVLIEKGQVRSFQKLNYLKDARYRGLYDDNPLFGASHENRPPDSPELGRNRL